MVVMLFQVVSVAAVLLVLAAPEGQGAPNLCHPEGGVGALAGGALREAAEGLPDPPRQCLSQLLLPAGPLPASVRPVRAVTVQVSALRQDLRPGNRRWHLCTRGPLSRHYV